MDILNTPLVNLALLEAMKGQRVTDEIDIFLPYLALSISKIEDDSFDIQDVKEKFKSEFSINPPEPALQTILTRAKKRGYIRLSNHQYFKVHDKLNEIVENNRNKRIEIQRSLSILISKFKDFSKEKHNTEINENEAESFLYKYIATNISAFIDVLSGNEFNVVTKIKNKDYLTASFIAFLNKEKTENLVYLDNLIKGTLLANYITYADKITSKTLFSDITVYLDSPILLGILGYSGTIQERSLSEFLNLLIALKINVCAFDITIDEIERLFGAWIDDLKNKRYENFKPKTLELLRAKGLDSESLETEKYLVESRIEKLGVKIVKNFSIKKNYLCSETALEEYLRNSGLNNNLKHDVTCISRIHNLREGKQVKSFDQKFSIFVTLNSTLEKSAYQYFLSECNKSIPIVSSEKWLATVLWLKKPNLFSNFTTNLLLSHAYSTIYCDDKFWNSFIRKLSDLKKRGEISENDFTLVRWDKHLIEKVHDISIEAGEDFSNGDIFDVVENIKNEHIKEKNRALLKLEETKNKELSDEKDKSNLLEKKNFNYKRKLTNLSKFISHFLCIVLFSFVIYQIFEALYISTPNVPLFEKSSTALDTSWATLRIAILFLFTLLGLLFGTTIKSCYVFIQKNIKNIIINFFEAA